MGSEISNSAFRIPHSALSLRKADETKAALKKSIADVEQVIKGLING